MEQLKGALLYGQSGGPTSVINSSFLGTAEEAFKHGCITKVLGADHGIRGILDDVLYDIGKEDRKELSYLKNTPGAALGSVRYKLKHFDEDESDYKKILETFKKHNVRYFFYNGGNDSMDTCNKISAYMKKVGYECRIMGISKTIDNDLFGTDHCPGYGSAAKYVATACMEIFRDATVYTTGSVTIVEIMGRNAGWLTGAAGIASHLGQGPDLIYLPEVSFSTEKFVSDIKSVYEKKQNVLVAISEGIKDKDNKYISEYNFASEGDAFGNKQLGGAANYLAQLVKANIKTKVRAIEFSLLQRCAAHIGSATDADEAYLAGAFAVRSAVDGQSGWMIGFERAPGKVYKCNPVLVPLTAAANTEKRVPLDCINAEGNFITDKFLDYALPLIQGENLPVFESGLPRFANLKKIKA